MCIVDHGNTPAKKTGNPPTMLPAQRHRAKDRCGNHPENDVVRDRLKNGPTHVRHTIGRIDDGATYGDVRNVAGGNGGIDFPSNDDRGLALENDAAVISLAQHRGNRQHVSDERW